MKKKYVVRVNVSYTKKYIVDAESVQDAEERYLLEGVSTSLMETEIDRKIISVLTDREKTQRKYGKYKYNSNLCFNFIVCILLCSYDCRER